MKIPCFYQFALAVAITLAAFFSTHAQETEKPKPFYERDFWLSIATPGRPDVAFGGVGVWETAPSLRLEATRDFVMEDISKILELTPVQAKELAEASMHATKNYDELTRQLLLDKKSENYQLNCTNELKKFDEAIRRVLLPHQLEFLDDHKRHKRLYDVGLVVALTSLFTDSVKPNEKDSGELSNELWQELKLERSKLQEKTKKRFSETLAELGKYIEDRTDEKETDLDLRLVALSLSSYKSTPNLELLRLHLQKAPQVSGLDFNDKNYVFRNLCWSVQIDEWGRLRYVQGNDLTISRSLQRSIFTNRDTAPTEDQQELIRAYWQNSKNIAKNKAKKEAVLRDFVAGKTTKEEYEREQTLLERDEIESDWKGFLEILLPHQKEKLALTLAINELAILGPFTFLDLYAKDLAKSSKFVSLRTDLEKDLNTFALDFHREVSAILIKHLNRKQRERFELHFGKIDPNRQTHLIGEFHLDPRQFLDPEWDSAFSNSSLPESK